jgi:hypothetical protein
MAMYFAHNCRYVPEQTIVSMGLSQELTSGIFEIYIFKCGKLGTKRWRLVLVVTAQPYPCLSGNRSF